MSESNTQLESTGTAPAGARMPTDQMQPTSTHAAASDRRKPRAVLDEVIHRFAVIGIWALMLAVYSILEPSKILQASAFQSIFGSQEPLVFLSLAALCCLMVGEFDLSVASNLGLAATIVPVLAVSHGMNVVLASVLAVLACATVGLVNGVIVVVVGVDGFIVTLGSSTALLGLALLISKSTTVYGLSQSFSNIALTNILGLPLTFYYGIIIALLFAYIVAFTPLGRRMTFVGASREVARLAGVRVDRIRLLSYVASGVICGIGGVLLVAGLGGFNSSSSPSFLLPALSAVFLGTAVIQPGRFNPLGSIVGVYFLATGILGLQLLGLGGWIEDAFYGTALVFAVSASSLVRRRRGRS